MKKVFSILTLLLAFLSVVHAQDAPPVSSSNGSTTSIVPTGNSGAMANHTNQVDLSTGGVSLSIPIYSLGSRQLSTNVSLSYQTPTSSFWMDEYPSSWVGRDWVLNAGGVITKEINSGAIDDTTIFPVYPGDRDVFPHTLRTLFRKGDEHRPSVYYYNFDGYAGRFILTWQNGRYEAITIPQSDLKIVPQGSTDNPRAWTVYTPDGTVYNFGGEYVETTDYDIEYYEFNVGTDRDNFEDFNLYYRPHRGNLYPYHFDSVVTNTSWYLNKINTPYSNDSIIFEYGEPYSSPLNQATIQHLVNYETDREEIRKYKVLSGKVKNQRRISKIISLTGSIEFDETADSLINKIEVKNKYNELIHKYHLNYQRKDDDHFLVSLQEKVIDCIEKPPYRFEYIDVNGTSLGTDPDYVYHLATFNGLPGGLQKIIYPEGGNTRFVYEANRADVSEWEYKDVEERIVLMRDTYDTLDVRYVEIGHSQNMQIKAVSYRSDYKLSIENMAGITVFSQFVTDSSHFSVPITAGKYKIIIDHPNHNSEIISDNINVIVHLKWKQKWLEPNTNVNAKGWRVKKVTLHNGIDTTKNIVKTYKYELENGNSSGRLIAPPLMFPMDDSDYKWQSGNFDAYAHNYYMYESETSMHNSPYGAMNIYHSERSNYPNEGEDTLARLKTFKVYTVNPNYLKGATQIQYTKVTEQYGENAEQGYVENYFSYENNEIATSAPMFTIRDNSWKRGFPVKTKVFDKDRNTISETTNEYEFSSLTTHPNQHYEKNTLAIAHRTSSYNPVSYMYHPGEAYYTTHAQDFMIGYHFGKEVAGSVFLKRTSTTNYDQDNSGNSITSITEYEYSDKYLFPKRVIHHESNGDKTISESKYVLDYDFDQNFTYQQEAGVLKTMKENHIISPVTEQTVWKQKAGEPKQLIGASLNTYQIYQTTIQKNHDISSSLHHFFSFLPKATYSFEPDQAGERILYGGFTFSSINSGQFQWENRYKKRINYEGADRFGNITSAREVHGVPSATIFGYNGLFPVASVSGASHRQVAYEGFESYGEENQYPDLKTDEVFRGKYSSGRFITEYIEGLPIRRRYLIYPNAKEPIPRGTYTLSFWARGSGSINLRSSYPGDYYTIDFDGDDQQWNYYEEDVFISNYETANSTNQNYVDYSLRGDNDHVRIDEIRFHPKNSFMATTTYKPLVGATHTTDAEQRTSSYYYDPLRRVESVRDHKNNLIKSYEYKYMSEDDNPNPLFSIYTNPTPEGLIDQLISIEVNEEDFGRCLNLNDSYPHKWNFGDGSSSLLINSQVTNQPHYYAQEGTYVITLSVEVVAGYWVDAHTSIRIIDPSSPPVFTNELTVTLTGTVDSTSSLCYDLVASPSGGTPPYTYQWFSGEGTSNPTQTTAQLHHCYATFGNFTPRVLLTDATGATAEATLDLSISNPIEPLEATIISEDDFCINTCTYFEAQVAGGSPAYTYLWEIVSSSTNTIMSLGTSPSLSFKFPSSTPLANQYTVYLTLTDSEGREVTTSKTIGVFEDRDCSNSDGGFKLRNYRDEPISINEIEVSPEPISFISPYQGSIYEWEITHNGNVLLSTTTPDSVLPIEFLLEGNYVVTCSVREIADFEGPGGTIATILVGTTTAYINICEELDLSRF